MGLGGKRGDVMLGLLLFCRSSGSYVVTLIFAHGEPGVGKRSQWHCV